MAMQIGLAQSNDERLWAEHEWNKTQDMDKANREERELDHNISNDNNKLMLDYKELNQKSENDKAELALERQQGRAVSVGS